MAEFNYHKFHRQRQTIKTIGWVLLGLGLFAVLDLFFREPMPLRGLKGLYAGLALLVVAGLTLYSGYKLPVAEALEIIHQHGRGISVGELIHEMRVDRVTADRIIAELVEKGFLRASGDSNAEKVYEAVR